MLYRVSVCQGVRGAARKALSPLGFIEAEGFTDGSTLWAFIIESEASAHELQEAVWKKLPSVWCKAEEEGEENHDNS